MKILTQPYLEQKAIWPHEGRHILAHFDDDSVIVYQAYRPGIGHFAAREGYFGGDFSLSRMSWVKPNFLWMMYRSGWGTKADQQVTLAVRVQRAFFDAVLAHAVPSSFGASDYADNDAWKAAVARSDVRLQWDPDHHPAGGKCDRRAIQLGLRGEMLRQYARDAVVEIEDISEFVESQRAHATPAKYDQLLMPRERVYVPPNAAIGTRLGLD